MQMAWRWSRDGGGELADAMGMKQGRNRDVMEIA